MTALSARSVTIANTARYSVATLAIKADPANPLVSGEGLADFRRNIFFARLTLRRAREAGALREKAVMGGQTYGRPPGGTWEKAGSPFDPDSFPFQVPDIDLLGVSTPWPRPTDDLEKRKLMFDALVSDINVIGQESLRSTLTWHVKLRLDPDRALPKLSDELKPLAADPFRQVEIWLDGQGRLRKLLVVEPAVHYAYELWDFDGPKASDFPPDLPA